MPGGGPPSQVSSFIGTCEPCSRWLSQRMVLAAQSGPEDNTVCTYEVQYRRSICSEPKSQCFPLESKFNTKPVYTGANTVYCSRQPRRDRTESPSTAALDPATFHLTTRYSSTSRKRKPLRTLCHPAVGFKGRPSTLQLTRPPGPCPRYHNQNNAGPVKLITD